VRSFLTLVTGPATEPVTLDEAKSWLRIDDDSSDAVITTLITTARTSAEQYLRRSLITQSWKLTLDLDRGSLDDRLGEGVYDLPITALYGGLPRTVELPKAPVQSITSVTTYDLDNTATTFSSGNYSVDSAGERLVLAYGAVWPANLRATSACEILYATGYGLTSTTVPGPIKTAILIMAASIYEQRGMCDDAMDIPPGAKQLLNQYRIMDYRG
jgi:hypothetical protein